MSAPAQQRRAKAARVADRAGLLARLRAGLLASEDFAEVAASRTSLKVRILKLRRAGFTIRAIEQDTMGRGRAPVAYQLLGEPACPCCGRGA
jgi:hypothetical protein